jgi:hypothetical protein
VVEEGGEALNEIADKIVHSHEDAYDMIDTAREALGKKEE